MIGRDRCPRIERVYSTRPSDALRAHLDGCEDCASRWRSMEDLSALGKRLPARPLSPARERAIRDALLARASGRGVPRAGLRPKRVMGVAIAASLAIAAVGIGVFLSGQPERPLYRAEIHAHEGAEFARVGASPDEIVRLREGSLTVRVSPLERGERMRVVTGDAEIEVRGTVFDVRVERDHLLSVHVLRGRVEIRRTSQPPLTLGPAGRWRRAPEIVADATESTARPSASAGNAVEAPGSAFGKDAGDALDRPNRAVITDRARHAARAESSASPAPRVTPHPTAQELRYQEGWAALRTDDLGRAVVAFEAAEALAGSAELARDAAYWRAVALGRSSRKKEAAETLQRYLDRHGESARADEAAAMLGWLLVERGETARAEVLFEMAARSSVPAARASGEQGLAAIRRGPPRPTPPVEPAGPTPPR